MMTKSTLRILALAALAVSAALSSGCACCGNKGTKVSSTACCSLEISGAQAV